ncbi:non-hydrolyzing UDP-N-acetylglucosamine 2-epimerase [Bowmanella sp. JS7-9]|uniref:Non-hydrolyzing UDP-N-acetylglucosamine 2-epimerase n=1 Tax=Pseudobowmanella zhangzhouensis TaxID=1537679 RepID=A0ABW1XGL5_9ALTE|nr:UDP-N-acetylglucosamine 2-epimerase (non-hydrolyzing) [Bowmanella sp. JS7-9]TBX25870.1 UDP-N-acetylglucosamine 2-epimerase [Bowmanella sp. JS7-9]
MKTTKDIRILTVVGARPQFIKAATVSRAIAQFASMHEVIVHTGQHHDINMSQVFFDEMQIPAPAYQLTCDGSGHGAMTGQMMQQLEPVMLTEKPDVVLVYGDTNSTLAGALTAAKLHIPVAHVEAGLRSFNMRMPEEVNRILTDRISRWLFCPTSIAVKNLNREGFGQFDCHISQPGDVMFDGALFYAQRAERPDNVSDSNFILATIHRAENTDDLTRLTGIVAALNQVSETMPVILPLHPRTMKAIQQAGLSFAEKVNVMPPQGYLQMVWLIQHSQLVLTDSGGLQKEAFFFTKPCITLRDETEWQELVDSGVNQLAGADTDTIVRCVHACLTSSSVNHTQPALYGDGNAAMRLVTILQQDLAAD